MKQEIIEESSHKLAIKKAIVYGVLVVAVLISAFMVVLQVFAYRHENYQEIDGVRHWFDDVVEVQSAIDAQHHKPNSAYPAH